MTPAETKQCQNCKNEFRIESEDFEFYEQVKVPPPTWCPACRNIRRMAAREIRTLYRDTCKLCNKPMISIHNPAGPFTVYCRPCWHSDKWDPMDYGREYDFERTFFEQHRELMEAVPRPALTGRNLVNSDFSHAGQSCKNCYMVFLSYFTQDSQNSWGLLMSRSAYDCFIADNSDNVYENLHVNRMYQVSFGYFSDECMDSAMLFDCVGCSNCFGCVNLRKKKYCLWNQQLSKSDYEEQRKYWDMGSYRKLLEAKEKFRALYLSLPHRYAHVLSSQNVTGDIIRDAKDCDTCFSVLDGVQNCKYVYFAGLNLKDSYDVTGSGDLSELIYECTHMTRAQRCLFSNGGSGSKNIAYCNWTHNCSELFGCIGLNNKRYCVLNRQYDPEEYRSLTGRIREQMDKLPYRDGRGREYRFGEFFPPELSAYPYNQSFAFDWYPKTKSEVLEAGWQWGDPPERNYHATLSASDLPDHIRETPDSVLGEVIGCEHADSGCDEQCATAFRLTKEELEFHRRMGLALPRLCSNCRFAQRLAWRNGLKLWRRKCMCHPESDVMRGNYRNTAKHFHGDQSCSREIVTTFSPENPETVYCEQCFQSEFL